MSSLRIAIRQSLLLEQQRTCIISKDDITPPIVNDCIFCSATSVEQDDKKSNYHAPSIQQDDMVHCLSCNRKACGTCIRGLHQFISQNNELSNNDASVVALNNMYHALSCPHKTVTVGTCCVFQKSISNNSIKRSTIKPPIPPTVGSIEGGSASTNNCSNTSTEPPSPGKHRVTAMNNLRQTIYRRKPKDSSKIDKLLDYHNPSAGYDHTDKLKITRPGKIKRKLRQRMKKPIQHNMYEGGLVVPAFNLLVTSDASSHHFYVDHMAFSKSEEDNTPTVLHSVVNKVSSDQAYRYCQENNKERKPFQHSDRKLVTLTVPSPEDISKSRKVTVDIRWVDQKLSTDETDTQFEKGTNTYSPEYLHSLNAFGNSDIADHVDYTLILGRYTKEDNNELPDKLLLFRPTSMMTNNILSVNDIDETAERVYDILRSYVGVGYEVHRFGGSSEMVTSSSDQDFLAVMQERKGLSPRHMYANIIIRCERWYWIVYRRVDEVDGSWYTKKKYSPPKDGGGFNMPQLLSSVFFILADISYNKMLVIMSVYPR